MTTIMASDWSRHRSRDLNTRILTCDWSAGLVGGQPRVWHCERSLSPRHLLRLAGADSSDRPISLQGRGLQHHVLSHHQAAVQVNVQPLIDLNTCLWLAIWSLRLWLAKGLKLWPRGTYVYWVLPPLPPQGRLSKSNLFPYPHLPPPWLHNTCMFRYWFLS